jgi:hypothetical protein
VLKDEIEKKSIKKDKNDQIQPELIYQTRDSSYKIMITQWKEIKTNYEI